MNSANLSIGLAIFFWIILHNKKQKTILFCIVAHLFNKIFTLDIINIIYSVLS